MLIYNINLTIVFVLLYKARQELELNKSKEKYDNYNFIAFMSMFLVSALRNYTVGTDSEMYMNIFRKINTYTLDSSPIEIGYFFLNKILSFINIFGGYQIIFIITSFIILFLIAKGIIKNSKRYELSVFLFITMYFYYNSFNQIRQYIAIAIMFYAIKYIFEKDFKKYAICAAIAFTFHQSSIIMIPFYFILQMDLSDKIVKIVLGLSVVGYLILDKVLLVVFSLIPRYQKYAQGELSSLLTEGSNIVHAIIILVLFIFVYKFKDKLVSIDKRNNIYINAILFATAFQILGTKTVLFSRIVYYFSIYAILLIPSIVDIFEGEDKQKAYLAIMAIYFVICNVLLLLNQSEVLPYMIVH